MKNLTPFDLCVALWKMDSRFTPTERPGTLRVGREEGITEELLKRLGVAVRLPRSTEGFSYEYQMVHCNGLPMFIEREQTRSSVRSGERERFCTPNNLREAMTVLTLLRDGEG